MPNYRSLRIEVRGDMIKIPVWSILSCTKILQKFGLFEDYLDVWVWNTSNFLKRIVKKSDIVFCTSGGELGTLKVGSNLKKSIGAKYVANFRDPLEHTMVNGSTKPDGFHVTREHLLEKYLSNADLVITSSKSYASHLTKSYPFLSLRVSTNYFGYYSLANEVARSQNLKKQITVGYMGTMTAAQSPEILIEAFLKLPEDKQSSLRLMLIGNHADYPKFDKYRNHDRIDFIDLMPVKKLNKLISQEVDIGFVSLVDKFYGACIPSKIYEYINNELPMLAALPEGDARHIIEENRFGLVADFKNIDLLSKNLLRMADRIFLEKTRAALAIARPEWSLEVRIKELDAMLRKLEET
jgi:glycosyltransferase involved in cell wall biosynthesis